MLKKEHDRLKKLKKQQQALQQSMLDTAIENQPSCEVGCESDQQSSFIHPIVWGTALLFMLVVLI